MTSSAKSQAQSIDEFPELMTTPQVARIFQVSTQTVQNWCRDGVFKGAIQPGGRQWRIPKASVLAKIHTDHG